MGIKTTKRVKGIQFVVTYHPQLLFIRYEWGDKKRIFSPRRMVSFRSPCKISSYLVTAKLYPLDRVVGSTKCGKKRCEVCMTVSLTDTITSNVTDETYKPNYKLIWTIAVRFTFCAVCVVENNMFGKQTFIIDGIAITKMKENMLAIKAVCKGSCLKIPRTLVSSRMSK